MVKPETLRKAEIALDVIVSGVFGVGAITNALQGHIYTAAASLGISASFASIELAKYYNNYITTQIARFAIIPAFLAWSYLRGK
mgnify:CR=1 FL=1